MRILEPYSLKGKTLRNRLALAAVTRGMAGDKGNATAEMGRYYESFASGGIGLIVSEAMYVAEQFSQTYVGQPGLSTPAQAAFWAPIIKGVRGHGARFFAQLQHGGAFREPPLGPGLDATGAVPTGLSWQQRLPYQSVLRADEAAIGRAVEGFARSAALAQEAGFDGIELHGARGYLLDAFMSGTNDRTDGFGGSLEDRMRFPRSVVEAVRRAAPDIVLSYNLSLYKMDKPDYQPPGARQEMEAIVRMLVEAGVDMIHVTTRAVDRCSVGDERLVDVVRSCFDGPLMANGGVKTLADAETLLERGRADMVSMARMLIANPDIIDRSREGREMTAYSRGLEKMPA